MVLITIDTLRADHLSSYGYPRQTSPFVDRLAAQSVVFTNAYATSSTTATSHASLFTSLYPAQHQLIRNGEELDESVLTMAQVFRRRGYRTAAFSTVGFLSTLERGFETFQVESGYHNATELFADARDWLDAVPQPEKIFLWIHLFDVHEWHVPQNLDPAFSGRAAATGPRDAQTFLDFLQTHHGLSPRFLGDPERLLEMIDAYDDQILSVDRAIETFFGDWQRRGLDDDTLWIVTADHGEGLGSHDYVGHGEQIYNEQIRVPLLIYDSGKRFPAGRVETLVSHVDLLPTLAELVDDPLEDQVFPVAGLSLLAASQEANGPADHHPEAGRPEGRPYREENADLDERAVISHRRERDDERRRSWVPGQVISLQTETHKYIHRTDASDEFFVLAQDPTEARNLIDEPSPIRDRMLLDLTARFIAMRQQGESLGRSEIASRHVEELRALGYL